MRLGGMCRTLTSGRAEMKPERWNWGLLVPLAVFGAIIVAAWGK